MANPAIILARKNRPKGRKTYLNNALSKRIKVSNICNIEVVAVQTTITTLVRFFSFFMLDPFSAQSKH